MWKIILLYLLTSPLPQALTCSHEPGDSSVIIASSKQTWCVLLEPTYGLQSEGLGILKETAI